MQTTKPYGPAYRTLALLACFALFGCETLKETRPVYQSSECLTDRKIVLNLCEATATSVMLLGGYAIECSALTRADATKVAENNARIEQRCGKPD